VNDQAWLKDLLRSQKEGSQLALTTDEEAQAFLLAGDTDRTQDYVFETNRLPEIRGASQQLIKLNQEGIRQILKKYGLPVNFIDDSEPGCLIYADGGSFLALVPPDATQAETLVTEIESLYPQETGTATISCVKLPVATSQGLGGYQPGYGGNELLNLLADLRDPVHADRIYAYYDISEMSLGQPHKRISERKSFQELVALAGVKLHQRKESKVAIPFLEALPQARRCQSCQIRPAREYGTDEDGQPWPLCPVCQGKVKASKRESWVERFKDSLKDDLMNWSKEYYGEYKGRKVHVARDLTEIGAACQGRKRGYIGFIYADGDSVGRYVQTRRTMYEYREASRLINQATWLAVVKALATNLSVARVTLSELKKEGPIHPFEIITVGGDDVLLIVPGHAALPVAITLSEEFEQNVRQVVDDPLRMSLGVVIADDHNPVRLLRDLAEDLLKRSAKPHSRETGQAAIDFHVLRSQAMLGGTVSQARERFPYLVEADREQLRLTGRPYTRAQVAAMWEALKALKHKGFPNSQLHALAENLPVGRGPSTLFYLYQSVRLQKIGFDNLHQTLQAAARRMATAHPAPWFYPSQSNAEWDFETPLWDVADLYDFVADH
jgi:CRISPR-associated protein Cmr2